MKIWFFARLTLPLQRFLNESTRDVVQLVVYLVWDQGVARSSRVIPTTDGTIICPIFYGYNATEKVEIQKKRIGLFCSTNGLLYLCKMK